MEVPDAARPSSPPRSPATGIDLPDRLADATPRPAAGTALFALARFEFEADRGNEGTKILMVEWDPSASPTALSPSSVSLGSSSKAWKVSWEGKANYLPASDNIVGTNKRVYFLLPPGATIPSVVTIAHPDGTVLTTKPLPAIFPPGLGAGSSDVGARGILHTIWAKKRLSELEEEIEVEMKANAESVGLEMALQERQWIVGHFGVGPRNDAGGNTTATASQTLRYPVPQKPTLGGRLGEKLRGLKLATSAADLIAGSADKNAHLHTVSFSPASNDMAVSSFSTFARQTIPGNPQPGESVSLDAILNNRNLPSKRQDQEQEEDLFALPMSPRSPEMKRSPFSLG
ncbi:hypothetical protein CTA2_4160 [Colletotrichum tanaceti]|uniref:Uncharacterized protein n=1 Tax=Colletotrichum tanaceti TaxID=1306861 RepID=A0A4U6XW68_9PEZI|nr:hypothetical protein CTA2_4160 [Colletotrichum tanaceti]TKW60232.1 hypothetical protein CTA1_4853 [Colletotrichum tanaceti]